MALHPNRKTARLYLTRAEDAAAESRRCIVLAAINAAHADGMSNTEMGARLGLAPTTISNILAGATVVRPSTVAKAYAGALEMLGGGEEPTARRVSR